MSFHIRTLDGGERFVVVASGELDAFAAPELRSALESAADRAYLVCDLAGADFLDSTALGVVVTAFRRAQEAGVRFTVVAPRGEARRIFSLTALDTVLPFEESSG